MFGEKKYIYVSVCFLHGAHPYSYRTEDASIKINDVIIVPTQDGEKPAIVSGVRKYKEAEVPYPLDKTKSVIRKAKWSERRAFKNIDMRMPLDISVVNVKTACGIRRIITDQTYRDKARAAYKSNPAITLIEKYPVSRAGQDVTDEAMRKVQKINSEIVAYWTEKEHLWGNKTYTCSHCKSMYEQPADYCPHCKAKITKTKKDPVWVDEMAEYDGDY